MTFDEFHRLPTRQQMFLSKLFRDLRTAEGIAAKSTHISDINRWQRVAMDLKNDIDRASKLGWRP